MKKRQILALGFFDGVHLGHQALLHECCDLATEYGCVPGAVTFAAHPETLVKGSSPALLNTLADRQRLLRQFGMEHVHVLAFDESVRKMPWQEFLMMLCREYHAAGLVCGEDFRFGYQGAGDAEKLRAQCAAWGIPCTVVPEQSIDGVRVSSTHIRELVKQGKMEQAMRFLGHPHILTGTVIPGRGLGRKLGIPTANLAIPEGVIAPQKGVYICRAGFDGRWYAAVTNVGMRPTVGGHHMTVEPWILDFEGDLYGRELTLEFHAWLRPETKFDSLGALTDEIQKNAGQARDFFEKS